MRRKEGILKHAVAEWVIKSLTVRDLITRCIGGGYRNAPLGIEILVVRACLETTRGAVFGEKAGWQARRRRRCARPPRSNSEGIREQGEARRPFPRKPSGRRVFCPWPALARSLQPAAGRCAPPRPPWPQPKSLAAAPLVVSKQALSNTRLSKIGRAHV